MKRLSILGLCALAACAPRTISVEVRNDSRQPVSAQIAVDRISLGQPRLTQANIGAGQGAILGPVEAPPMESIELRVRTRGVLGAMPAAVRLPRGRSVAIVENGGYAGDDLRVRLLRSTGE